ncbi:MAG: zinc ribbon domain-containing protein [Bacilli bacterium]|nr:zinc ribbon domain-containing protein [Bacilli bacterium]
MSEIYCPFCGKVIEANTTVCPNCGRQIQVNTDVGVIPGPKPKNPKWVIKWKLKPFIYIGVFLALFIAFLILTLNRYAERPDTSTIQGQIEEILNPTPVDVFLDLVCPIITVIAGIGLLYSLLFRRVRSATIDGYNVVVACGFFHRLVIEDRVVLCRLNTNQYLIIPNHTKELVGYLPNKKKVWADVNSLLGFSEIHVGQPNDY